MKVETEWTDEYFNLMLIHHIERKIFENNPDESEKSRKKETIKQPEKKVMQTLGIGAILPYPNVTK